MKSLIPLSKPKEVLEKSAKTMHQIQPGSTSNSKPEGYSPQQIRRAYEIDKLIKKGITGKGQNIAIIVAFGDPTVKENLKKFSKQFDLPKAKLKIYFPQGEPVKSDPFWATETNIDVQWAHALAPCATIHLIVAKDDFFSSLFAAIGFANTLGVQVISMSWGAPEFPGEELGDPFLQNPGTVYLAASGDAGGGNTNYPAASPFVLAVGGTRLPLDRKGNRTGLETGWIGSGGGISPFEPEPTYQIEFGVASAGRRGIPDVSLVADPATGVAVFDGQNGWKVFGGTSVSAPCWAAIIALADQIRIVPLSDGHQELYNLAKGSDYAKNYRDIIIGTNGPFDCLPGNDFVTGLGSPRAYHLVRRLG